MGAALRPLSTGQGLKILARRIFFFFDNLERKRKKALMLDPLIRTLFFSGRLSSFEVMCRPVKGNPAASPLYA